MSTSCCSVCTPEKISYMVTMRGSGRDKVKDPSYDYFETIE